jgi:hypothetical protein
MLHSHPSFHVWAVVFGVAAVLILAAFLRRLFRGHLARLAVCLAVGAAAAFGVTGWADGQRHAALATAAHAGHGHAVSVTIQLAAAFTVITVVVAAVAFTVSVLAGRRRGRPYAQYDQYPQYGQRPARRGRTSAARRGW